MSLRLYVEDFKAEKLAAKFKSVTKTNKVGSPYIQQVPHTLPYGYRALYMKTGYMSLIHD